MSTTLCEKCWPDWGHYEVITTAVLPVCESCNAGEFTVNHNMHTFRTDPRIKERKMEDEDCRAFAIKALENMRGDDLYRARAAFRNCTPAQMKEQYGQSGSTCEEILAEYESFDAKISETIAWVQSV